ncbi:unnamed protein product, partial [Heterotrigona itama]
MPKLNKLLVTSIIADIRECVHVSNEMYSWLGDIEHLSWKFPTKTAKGINAMEIVKEHDGTAGEFYILLLELAYDRSRLCCRIHFVLRLIVEFMDKFPFVEDFFSEASCVSRSNQISLASLLRLVWDRLKTMPDSISRRMEQRQQVKNSENEARKTFEASKVSQSSQASSSVNYCESCTLAGEAILQAINVIEQVFLENKLISVAATERDECRNDIYEKTQWAVMSKLTKGIGTDVDTALRMASESNLRTQVARRDHEQAIRQLRSSLTMQEKRTDALHAENLELKNLLENGGFSNSETWSLQWVSGIAANSEANRWPALICSECMYVIRMGVIVVEQPAGNSIERFFCRVAHTGVRWTRFGNRSRTIY